MSNLSNREPAPRADGKRLSASVGAKGPALRDWPEAELVRIRRFLRKLTSLRVMNPADAEDLVQETFLTMTQKCHQIELRKGLLVWGLGILHRKVGNYYRRGRRLVSMEQEAVRAEADSLRRQEPLPEDCLRRSEMEALLQKLVQELPTRERVVMEMVQAGLSTSEIVERLSPERYQNVVNRIHRARLRLSRELARRGHRVRFVRAQGPRKRLGRGRD